MLGNAVEDTKKGIQKGEKHTRSHLHSKVFYEFHTGKAFDKVTREKMWDILERGLKKKIRIINI